MTKLSIERTVRTRDGLVPASQILGLKAEQDNRGWYVVATTKAGETYEVDAFGAGYLTDRFEHYSICLAFLLKIQNRIDRWEI